MSVPTVHLDECPEPAANAPVGDCFVAYGPWIGGSPTFEARFVARPVREPSDRKVTRLMPSTSYRLL